MAGEGGIRVAAMVDHPALAVRDPDAVRNEIPDCAHANPRRDVNSNTPRLDVHQSIWDPVRVTLQPIQPPSKRDMHVEALHLAPAVKTAVRIEGELKKVRQNRLRCPAAHFQVAPRTAALTLAGVKGT